MTSASVITVEAMTIKKIIAAERKQAVMGAMAQWLDLVADPTAETLPHITNCTSTRLPAPDGFAAAAVLKRYVDSP